jgi:hypothetical protein
MTHAPHELIVQSCGFNVTGDPKVSQLNVWVDSDKFEAIRDDKALEGGDHDKVADVISNKCNKI